MVTNEQWRASKYYAWGLACLLIAFLILEIAAFLQDRMQRLDRAISITKMQEHVAASAKIATDNAEKLKTLSDNLAAATTKVDKMSKQLAYCARCHVHEFMTDSAKETTNNKSRKKEK